MVDRKDILPSHHWVQQVLVGQQDLGLPNNIKKQTGLLITVTCSLCNKDSRVTAFNKL